MQTNADSTCVLEGFLYQKDMGAERQNSHGFLFFMDFVRMTTTRNQPITTPSHNFTNLSLFLVSPSLSLSGITLSGLAAKDNTTGQHQRRLATGEINEWSIQAQRGRTQPLGPVRATRDAALPPRSNKRLDPKFQLLASSLKLPHP